MIYAQKIMVQWRDMVVGDLDDIAVQKRKRIVITGREDKVIHGFTDRIVGKANSAIFEQMAH